MTTRRPCIAVTMLCCLLAAATSAVAVDTPPWDGPKNLETKYRQDWYACYTEAEKTMPPVNLQVSGDQSMYAVGIAIAARNKSVGDLALACLGARGYSQTQDKVPAVAPAVVPPASKTK